MYCEILRAEITESQCLCNCALATKQYKEYMMGWTDLGETFEQEIKAFWNWQEDNKTINCVSCERYEEPSDAMILRLAKTKRIKRNVDTPVGRIERSILSYILTSQEKLYDEERHHLSRSSSITADVSQLYVET